MQQLLAPDTMLQTVLPKCSLPEQEVLVIPSQFALSFEHKSGMRGLFSTFTKEALLFETDECSCIGAFRSLETPLLVAGSADDSKQETVFSGETARLDWKDSPHIRGSLSPLFFNPEDVCIRTLFEKGFLVLPDTDETKTYRDARRLLRTLALPKTPSYNHYTILPTMLCNARCAYCFENGQHQFPMTDETAQATADFILRTRKGDDLLLTWFGGEPLLGERQIDLITEKLIQEGIRFRSRMPSNALLFTPELIHKAREQWGLENVQITLDGTEENYNRIKDYRGISGSAYQRVLSNIEALLAAGIRVIARLNFSHENIDDLELLADELSARFGSTEGFSIHLQQLFDDEFSCYTGELLSQEKANLFTRVDALRISFTGEEAPIKPSLKLALISCKAEQENVAITIHANGALTDCEHCLDGRFFGDVWSGITEPKLAHELQEPAELRRECADCPFLPLCTDYGRCPNYYERVLPQRASLRRMLRTCPLD